MVAFEPDAHFAQLFLQPKSGTRGREGLGFLRHHESWLDFEFELEQSWHQICCCLI